MTNLLATTVGDSGEKSIKNSKITENYMSEVATGQDSGDGAADGTNSSIFAMPYTKDGNKGVLLVNKKATAVELTIKGATGGQATVVEVNTDPACSEPGFEPQIRKPISEAGVLSLGPFAVAVVTELTLSAADDDDRPARMSGTSLKGLKSDDVEREVQLWTCGRDPTVNTPVGPVGQIEWSLFSHIQNITSVSVCGVSLGADGRLNASAAALKQAQLFAGTMGLAVYPLIGGNLSSLHAAMGRGDAFFADSIALATTLVADGFNLE